MFQGPVVASTKFFAGLKLDFILFFSLLQQGVKKKYGHNPCSSTINLREYGNE